MSHDTTLRGPENSSFFCNFLEAITSFSYLFLGSRFAIVRRLSVFSAVILERCLFTIQPILENSLSGATDDDFIDRTKVAHRDRQSGSACRWLESFQKI